MASPKQMGSIPVANGSSAPVCPALFAWNKRLTFCIMSLDDMPCGLSNKNTPSISRPRLRGLDISHFPQRVFSRLHVLRLLLN